MILLVGFKFGYFVVFECMNYKVIVFWFKLYENYNGSFLKVNKLY